MDAKLALISDAAYTDKSTGKMYVLGIVRYILARTVPATVESLAASFTLEEYTAHVPASGAPLSVFIVNEDGGQIGPPSPEMKLKFRKIGPAASTKSEANLHVNFEQFTVPSFGTFAVLLKNPAGEVLARAEFSVIKQPEPVPAE